MCEESVVEAGRDSLLVEYQEIAAYQRHDDSTKWTIVALTFGGAAASIAWMSTNFPYLLGLALILAAALVWVGARSYEQFQAASRIRLSRASDIERILGMDHHLRICRHSQPDYEGDLRYPGGFAPNLVRYSKATSLALLVIGVAALFIGPAWALAGALAHRFQ